MKKTITITVDAYCGEATPSQVQNYIDDIIGNIKEKALGYRSDPDYNILHIAWDEPRKLDLTIDVDVT